eukprot:1136464-Pelagomonas_calceolata.AAC.1
MASITPVMVCTCVVQDRQPENTGSEISAILDGQHHARRGLHLCGPGWTAGEHRINNHSHP